MPLSNVFQAAFSRPMKRFLDQPVRELMEEVLADHGYASPGEVAVLEEALNEAQRQVAIQEAKILQLESRTQVLIQHLDDEA